MPEGITQALESVATETAKVLTDEQKATSFAERARPHRFTGSAPFDDLAKVQVSQAIDRVGKEYVGPLRDAIADGHFNGLSYNWGDSTKPVDYDAVVRPGSGCFFALLSQVSGKSLGFVKGIPPVADPNRYSWITHLELCLNKERGMSDKVKQLDQHLESIS